MALLLALRWAVSYSPSAAEGVFLTEMKACLKDVKGCVFSKDCPNTRFPVLLAEMKLKMQAENSPPCPGDPGLEDGSHHAGQFLPCLPTLIRGSLGVWSFVTMNSFTSAL